MTRAVIRGADLAESRGRPALAWRDRRAAALERRAIGLIFC